MQDVSSIIAELQQDFPGIRYVRQVKTGKEATVHVLGANQGLLALKVYKQDIKFASRKDYFNQREILESRVGRAIHNNSRFGKKAMLSVWAYREYDALRKLAESGAAVPGVYKVADNYLLMEFIGHAGIPTPQLYTQKLSRDSAQNCFQQIAENIEMFWRAGYVHGDLSAYNILWDGERATIIDFPQVIKLSQTSSAPDRLLRDIENVDQYFGKYKLADYSESILELKNLVQEYYL
ncbi:hypothetical protein KC640_01875 [Candidatus Dojkabacteria bacterium]|uniref:non-specific serine/threonine protein kinase n=1 Tax=Candidatus Dojkabacteria bacterium TaxID=2099670 RepID=A0A955I770_9BACT|nr:hypothetical protein [Candidatus Dojkabacteria bacterium]